MTFLQRILLVLVWLPAVAMANTQSPIGIGLYSELKKGYFYGALYCELETQDESLLMSYKGFKQLEMRIAVDSISPRKFRKLFNNMIAISNPSSVYEKHGNDIVRFTEILKDKLVMGDQIIVNNDKQKTQVFINRQLALTLNNPQFLNVLLKGWIGRFPPNAQFKQDVLGLSGQPHKNAFYTLNYSDQRQQQIAAWWQDDTLTTQAQQEKEQQAERERQRIAAAEQKRLETLAKQAKTQQEQKAAQRLAAIAREKQIEEEAKQKALTLKRAQERERKIQAEQKRIAELEKIQLLENRYFKQLVRAANEKVMYPEKAYRRGQEGYVKIRVFINAEGEVMDAETEQSSEVSALDRAALKAAKKASPYPPIPKEIPLDEGQYEFSIPFRFVASN